MKMRAAIIVFAAALALGGCSQYSESDRAVGGGLLGAGAGASIGGAATTPKACWARDAYGNSYRVTCP
jgi:hypothetical protein